MLDLSKFLKGLMKEKPVKFVGLRFKRGRGLTLTSKREEHKRMFLILMVKLGMQEG